MKNLTTKQKRNLLTELILLKNDCGYHVADFIGRPLNYFNYDKVQEVIKSTIIEWEGMNGCEYSSPYSLEA